MHQTEGMEIVTGIHIR